MTLSNRVDVDRARDELARWLAPKIPDARRVDVSNVRVSKASGLSTETILFDADWHDVAGAQRQSLVARVEPLEEGLFMSYDLEAEYRLMHALGEHTKVPVPRMWGYEGDRSILGAPFLVMEFVTGRAPQDDPPYTVSGWVQELDAVQRAKLVDHGLGAMAAIHAVDYKKLGLDFLDRGSESGDVIDRRIALWHRTLEWATAGVDRNPTAEAALDWLQRNRPSKIAAPVLTWGDARLGNMLFADDLGVAAVIDWEIAALGTPEMDLGWWLFMQKHHTVAIGAPLPQGIPDRDATLRRYEEISGYKPQDMLFYQVLAAVGGAAVSHRLGSLMIARGLLPPDAPIKVSNPSTHTIAALLDLPPPDGSSQTYIGRR